MKGKQFLIVGNHDGRLLGDSVAMSYFEGVDKMYHVSNNGKHVHICHFPLAEWNGMYRGAYHVYGHIYNSTGVTFQIMKTLDRALNCGVSVNGYAPVTLGEMIENNRIFQELNATGSCG